MRKKPVRNSGMGSSHCLKLLVVFALGRPGSELSKHYRKPCPTFHSWRGKRGSVWEAESVPGEMEDSHWEFSLYWLRCPFSEMEKSENSDSSNEEISYLIVVELQKTRVS